MDLSILPQKSISHEPSPPNLKKSSVLDFCVVGGKKVWGERILLPSPVAFKSGNRSPAAIPLTARASLILAYATHQLQVTFDQPFLLIRLVHRVVEHCPPGLKICLPISKSLCYFLMPGVLHFQIWRCVVWP